MHRLSLLAIPCLALTAACGDDVSSASDTEGDETSSSTSTSTSTTSGPTTTTTTTASSSTTDEPMTSSATTVDPATSVGSSESGEESSSSTGEPDPCGDGRVEDPEECDDGNNDDGDGCSSTCTIPFAVDWTVTFNGEMSNVDNGNGVVIDDAGNVFVIGTTTNVATGRDIFLAMYQPDGTESWAVSFDNGANDSDRGFGLALHTSGDIIVVGNTDVSADDTDALVMRVSAADQSVVWTQLHDGPAGGDETENFDAFASVAVDSLGDIVVVGNEREVDQRSNVFVRKYDADGNMVWTDTYNGSESVSDFGQDIAIEADDDIVIMASTGEADPDEDAFVRRYSPDGTIQETVLFPFNGRSVESLPSGNVLVSGFDGNLGLAFVAELDPSFEEVWMSGAAISQSFVGVNAVAADDSGVYIAGFTPVVNQQDNIFVGALDPMGLPIWSDTYNNEVASLGDFGTDVAVGPDGSVVAIGSETVLGEQSNIWIRKYSNL